MDVKGGTKIIILAGGMGKRMGGGVPKVLTPLFDRPIISYLLDSIERSGVDKKPVIVVGKAAERVQNVLGNAYTYIHQSQQLGTGHAVMVCKDELLGKYEDILVLYGDHPLLSSEAIVTLEKIHKQTNAILTLMTVDVADFSGWKKPFYHYGRIIRNEAGEIASIIEFKDCTEEQKRITEVNPSFFCFRADWLWDNIVNLRNENAQQEFYLTDLVYIALSQGKKVSSVRVEPRVAIGVNTPDELAIAENLLKEYN